MRLSVEIGSSWAWTLAALAGASNLIQANITDYYKTLHLYYISLKKGAEFDTVDRVRAKYRQMPRGFNKGLYWLYLWYTILQTKATPNLQRLLTRLKVKYGEDFPEEVRLRLRAKNLKIMPLINQTTFNGRFIAMVFALAINQMWVYLAYEIVILNALLFIAILKHEDMSKNFEI
jgi:hypothetical protein